MATRRGLDVPVEFQAYKNRAEEIRDLVADNKLGELVESDDDALLQLLTELGSADLDLSAVNTDEMAALLASLSDQPLRVLSIPDPPKMAWALIAIPLTRFAEISPQIEAIAAVQGSFVETTVSDLEPPDAEED
jgi:hypothetical protein